MRYLIYIFSFEGGGGVKRFSFEVKYTTIHKIRFFFFYEQVIQRKEKIDIIVKRKIILYFINQALIYLISVLLH